MEIPIPRKIVFILRWGPGAEIQQPVQPTWLRTSQKANIYDIHISWKKTQQVKFQVVS